ncbi:MAG: type I-E CRISPR-associated protein Cas5/CasD [Bryobacterales bacterium]|nr:type I-E CRISPR-associated protein Cas5/CasD [Bryobacterales bacterium]
MKVLLLRLSGPFQSWGTQSRFTIRDTGLEPSKSGVVGLLCAALGKPRRERPGDSVPALATLAGLRMGVRVDQEGVRKVDYHTAGGGTLNGKRYGVVKADGTPGDTVVSSRYYLAGAAFLVGLEGDAQLLGDLRSALQRPVWQLCLGRKSFVPDGPIYLPDGEPWNGGLIDGSLEKALREARPVTLLNGLSGPSQEAKKKGQPLVRLVLETSDPEHAEVRMDQPLSFEPRRFGARYVRTQWIPIPIPEGR